MLQELAVGQNEEVFPMAAEIAGAMDTEYDNTGDTSELDELDDLLKVSAIPATNSFADLDDLLGDSLRLVREKEAVKAARKKLSAGNMNALEREILEAAVRKYELAREYDAKAQVLMFNVQLCKCGAEHNHFVGVFQRQQHRTSAISRWQVAVAPSLQVMLPKEIKRNIEAVEICTSCMTTQGWPV